jgi:FdrA protein
MEEQIRQLKAAGARVETSNDVATRYVGQLVQALSEPAQSAAVVPQVSVGLATLQRPLAGINVGLESFAESMIAQGAEAIQVDWRPPAGGNEKLMAILERMKSK